MRSAATGGHGWPLRQLVYVCIILQAGSVATDGGTACNGLSWRAFECATISSFLVTLQCHQGGCSALIYSSTPIDMRK
eukprot:1138705-Pelagomonas_calceolata.AAC.2